MGQSRCKLFVVLAIFGCFWIASPGECGFLVSPGMRWQTYSFRPVADEQTPVYYGYGGTLHLGYSVSQVFDIAVFGDYTPGSLRTARPPSRDDAVLQFYGGEMGFRIVHTLYLAFRAGQMDFELQKKYKPEEIEGAWSGLAVGGSMGAIFSLNKEHYWQMSVDFHSVSEMEKTEKTPDDTLRKFDAFSVTMSYVFNSFESSSLEGTAFGQFLGGFW